MKNEAVLFLAVVVACIIFAGTATAESFDFGCETPVTVNGEFDGEIKYRCTVTNTGDSFLQLYYETKPEQNPIDPNLAIGFHPQPSKIYLEPGESQPIVGFEVPPRVPQGQDELSYTRTITVRPADDGSQPKQAMITTIIKSQLLNDDGKIFGKIIDAQTAQPIPDAEVFFKYKKLERKTRVSPTGDYNVNLPQLPYLMMVQARDYELFSEQISANDNLKKDIQLNRAAEKGNYNLVKEMKLDAGAWEGVWRAAANGDYIAFGMGGHPVKTGSEGYAYLFDSTGEQLLKIKTADEVRGIDVAPDGRIALSLGSQRESAEQYEKVLLYRKNGELLWKKNIKESPFQEIRFSHDGRFVAVGDTEGYVYLLDAADGKEAWKRFTNGQVRAIRFYDDDSHMLVGSGDDHVYLFDISGNKKWKTYVHSWSYGFIAATPGNDFSAAGGHVGFLHLLDKSGKDIWAYETDGGFRWAEIGPDASYVVGGTRSELVFLDGMGKVVWKGYDSVSGATTKDKKYILSGNQRGEFELRNTGGTILWKHETQDLEPGKDVRFSYISDDAAVIVGAVKTGEVYFFNGEIVKVPLETKEEANKKIGSQAPQGIGEPGYPPAVEERQPDAEKNPLQGSLLWIIIPVSAIVLLAMIVMYVVRKR